MNYLLVFLAVSLPLMGMVYAVLGSVKLPLAERLGMDEAKVGGLVSAYGFMVGPVILICGFLTDAFGRMPIITAGSILAACALFLLARTRSYGVAVVAVLMLSGGWAAMINVGNVLMPLAVPGNPSRATNLGDFFFGLGAFLAPMVVVTLVRRIGYTGAVSTLAGLTLLTAALALLGPRGVMQGEASQPVDTSVLLGDPVMWLCALTLMFYVPLESSIAAWATTLVSRQPAPPGADARRAPSIALSCFWLCFMGARLLTAGFIRQKDEHLLHIVLALAITGVLIGLMLSRSRKLTIGLVIAAGALFGPVFPTLVGILFGHFHDQQQLWGRAIGLLFGVASIGWTLIPIALGAYAARTDIQRALRIAVAVSVVFTGLVVGHYIYAGGGHAPQPAATAAAP